MNRLAVFLTCSVCVFAAGPGLKNSVELSEQIVPLKIGNTYFFECHLRSHAYNKPSVNEFYPSICTIRDTTRLNNKKHFIIERLAIPAYSKEIEYWYTDSTVFAISGDVLYNKKIVRDTLWNSNRCYYQVAVKTDTIFGIIGKA